MRTYSTEKQTPPSKTNPRVRQQSRSNGQKEAAAEAAQTLAQEYERNTFINWKDSMGNKFNQGANKVKLKKAENKYKEKEWNNNTGTSDWNNNNSSSDQQPTLSSGGSSSSSGKINGQGKQFINDYKPSLSGGQNGNGNKVINFGNDNANSTWNQNNQGLDIDIMITRHGHSPWSDPSPSSSGSWSDDQNQSQGQDQDTLPRGWTIQPDSNCDNNNTPTYGGSNSNSSPSDEDPKVDPNNPENINNDNDPDQKQTLNPDSFTDQDPDNGSSSSSGDNNNYEVPVTFSGDMYYGSDGKLYKSGSMGWLCCWPLFKCGCCDCCNCWCIITAVMSIMIPLAIMLMCLRMHWRKQRWGSRKQQVKFEEFQQKERQHVRELERQNWMQMQKDKQKKKIQQKIRIWQLQKQGGKGAWSGLSQMSSSSTVGASGVFGQGDYGQYGSNQQTSYGSLQSQISSYSSGGGIGNSNNLPQVTTPQSQYTNITPRQFEDELDRDDFQGGGIPYQFSVSSKASSNSNSSPWSSSGGWSMASTRTDRQSYNWYWDEGDEKESKEYNLLSTDELESTLNSVLEQDKYQMQWSQIGYRVDCDTSINTGQSQYPAAISNQSSLAGLGGSQYGNSSTNSISNPKIVAAGGNSPFAEDRNSTTSSSNWNTQSANLNTNTSSANTNCNTNTSSATGPTWMDALLTRYGGDAASQAQHQPSQTRRGSVQSWWSSAWNPFNTWSGISSSTVIDSANKDINNTNNLTTNIHYDISDMNNSSCFDNDTRVGNVERARDYYNYSREYRDRDNNSANIMTDSYLSSGFGTSETGLTDNTKSDLQMMGISLLGGVGGGSPGSCMSGGSWGGALGALSSSYGGTGNSYFISQQYLIGGGWGTGLGTPTPGSGSGNLGQLGKQTSNSLLNYNQQTTSFSVPPWPSDNASMLSILNWQWKWIAWGQTSGLDPGQREISTSSWWSNASNTNSNMGYYNSNTKPQFQPANQQLDESSGQQQGQFGFGTERRVRSSQIRQQRLKTGTWASNVSGQQQQQQIGQWQIGQSSNSNVNQKVNAIQNQQQSIWNAPNGTTWSKPKRGSVRYRMGSQRGAGAAVIGGSNAIPNGTTWGQAASGGINTAGEGSNSNRTLSISPSKGGPVIPLARKRSNQGENVNALSMISERDEIESY